MQFMPLLGFTLAFSVVVASGATARRGTQVWEFVADAPLNGPPAVAPDGTVYFTSQNSSLYALDRSGHRRWVAANAGYSAPTIGKHAVYVAGGPWNADGSIRGAITAYRFTGSRLWRLPVSGNVTTSASLGRNGTLYVGSGEGDLFAVSADGTLLWTGGGGDWLLGEPSIGRHGTIYYSIGADAPFAYAVTPAGDRLWEASAPSEFPTSFAIAEDGTLYFGVDRAMQALNSDGSLRWTFPLEAFSQSPPTIDKHGTIYIASGVVLHALTPQGTEKWHFSHTDAATGDALPISAAALGRDGAVYVVIGKDLVALRNDGVVAWRFHANATAITSPVIGPRGIVYFADAASRLHAVQGGDPVSHKGWPMFRHDARGTSNVKN